MQAGEIQVVEKKNRYYLRLDGRRAALGRFGTRRSLDFLGFHGIMIPPCFKNGVS
jgi:hypothetical protein